MECRVVVARSWERKEWRVWRVTIYFVYFILFIGCVEWLVGS